MPDLHPSDQQAQPANEEADRLRVELANSEAERTKLVTRLAEAKALIVRCDLAMTVASMSVGEALARCCEVLPKESHDDDISVAVGRTIELLRRQIDVAREESRRHYADAVQMDNKNTQIVLALASIARDNGVDAIEAKAKACIVKCSAEECSETAQHKCEAHDCRIALCTKCADKHRHATYHDTSPMRDTLASDVLAMCRIVDEYDKVIAAIVSGRDVTANATTEASGVGR